MVALGGLAVASAFVHDGSAASLVHRLKYDGIEGAAAILARAMAELVPADAECLVPVPRAVGRRWRYGIDSGQALAVRVGDLTGLPVRAVLARPLWHPRQAGKARDERRRRSYRRKERVSGAVVIDDVITTGATVSAAAHAVGDVIGGVTATRARGTSLFMSASS
jgi:predicted amidophosphoribosyltransferase